MKMHGTTIERLIQVFEVWGGRQNESRLREELMKLDLAVYNRLDGQAVVVLEADLQAKTKPAG